MKAYMTTGTIDFLKTLEEKYSGIALRLMYNSEGGLAYYEHVDKTVFQSGRAYEILTAAGEVLETGYIVMNHIPVPEESQPVFEDRFINRQHTVETMPGFQGFRLLKPKRGNTYVVLTQWASVKDFDNWKNSAEFAGAHKKQTTKPPAHFSEKPYVTTYLMYTEEEDN
ncbi:antibiotic biosynthesis monooxygenase family protein [Oceanobacillus sp. FSL H7-0719]|uniref:antibiotic biosynthesis monooxygenase family protein n=1 Tax=Oceanobacillus sp. FSL H7-0719 TaxID=2954507 RepID=UPI0032534144